MIAISSLSGDMKVGLYKTSPEIFKEISLQRPKVKSSGSAGSKLTHIASHLLLRSSLGILWGPIQPA